MSTLNPFQQSLIEYLGGTTGGALGPGVTDSSLAGTKADSFYVNYTEGVGNQCDCGIELTAQPSAGLAFIDIHTTPGYFNNNADFRMIFGGGATGTDLQAGMNSQGAGITWFHPVRTNPPSAPTPPAWFADYGAVAATAGNNQDTTITFNTVFQTAPRVLLQLFDTDGPGVNPVPSGFVYHTYNTTTTTTTVRGLGNLPVNFQYHWFAIGGVA